MANINELYPSNFIRAADLEGNEWTLTITQMNEAEPMQDGKFKPAIYFQEYDKGLILNKTNAMTIAGYYGPETSGWIGKQIILYPAKVQFNNQMTDAIRVRAPARQAAPPPRTRPATPQGPAMHKPVAHKNPAQAVGFEDENEDPAPRVAGKR